MEGSSAAAFARHTNGKETKDMGPIDESLPKQCDVCRVGLGD
jgi:hypothetical protein